MAKYERNIFVKKSQKEEEEKISKQNFLIIDKLNKSYGSVKAVKDLCLAVQAGEIFGFLGPNGAGKTTTIRIMTTLTKPASGSVKINGYDVVKEADKVKEIIGVVQQHISLDRDISVKENMEYHARIHHLTPTERKQRISELLEYAELTNFANRLVDALSGGMKRKLSIACSLLHKPKILFLDEPTAGLVTQARRRLWDLIRRLKAYGTTVFITTHYIDEAEALCDRVGIIHHGQLIAQGTPTELCSKLGAIAVEIFSETKGTSYKFFNDRTAANNYVQAFSSDASRVIIRNSDLEDFFMEQTGEKVGGA